ncbi:MAG: EAL domain-containing protein [Hyphomicrobiaceae bacterium]|nr:EAL domain-containing protein [Hyphomicrobiaceae bacterium]
MQPSANLRMPAIDYVSVIASLYKDKRAVILGTLASAIGAFAAGHAADAPILYVHAVLFVITAFVRYSEAVRFAKNPPKETEVAKAMRWERRAFIAGTFTGINYGMWCFTSLVFVHSPYAELVAVSVTIAAMVGLVARNFGLDKLLVTQSILMGGPLCVALVMTGDFYHILLATLVAPMILSFRAVARDVRNVLLAAVHDRVAVSKLARELDTALATVSHGICMLDRDLRVAVANRRFADLLFGEPVSNVLGLNFKDVLARAESMGTMSRLSTERLMTAVATGTSTRLVVPMAHSAQCELFITTANEQIALVVEDISERLENENRIRYMARYDALTGLPNRAYFTEQVDLRLSRAALLASAPQTMLMIVDLDDFKHVNDTLGHPTGDKLLEHVAHRIRQQLDSPVVVGRFGGDEFTIFDDRDLTLSDANTVAERLMAVLNEPYELGNEQITVRFSIGFVLCNRQERKLDEMLKRADLALYSAKADGKGRVCAYHTDLDKSYQYRQTLKKALRESIDRSELSLMFQPIVDAHSGRIVSCEALARWHHPEFGSIPPSVFIPIAEEMGAISDVTDWVMRTAARTCVNWPKDVSVSVNTSAHDFKDARVIEMVRDALAESGLAPERLEIEVTESALLEERQTAFNVLSALSEMGARIALDDFGTGYSSLSYLHELPFNKLKIDRAFTQNVTEDERSLKLMRSIAQMSKDLDLIVTVEGVETHEQLDTITALGLVDQIQGYLFGAPVPEREIVEMIGRLRGAPSAEPRASEAAPVSNRR